MLVCGAPGPFTLRPGEPLSVVHCHVVVGMIDEIVGYVVAVAEVNGAASSVEHGERQHPIMERHYPTPARKSDRMINHSALQFGQSRNH